MAKTPDVDFGLTADDYSTHRAGFPDSFFDRIRDFGVGVPGQRIADLGTGTGTLARGFAARGCQCTGIDPSSAMLSGARRLAEAEGLDLAFREANAEDTGLETSSFEVVTAGQCWHWFDRPRAIHEVRRILVPSGQLVIAHFDWLPLAGNIVAATEALIDKHNPNWNMGGGIGVHPWWLPDLGEHGMEDIETFSYDCDARYTPESWRGRIRASAGVGVALDDAAVAAFDAEHAALLAERFPGEELAVPHRVYAIVCRSPG